MISLTLPQIILVALATTTVLGWGALIAMCCGIASSRNEDAATEGDDHD